MKKLLTLTLFFFVIINLNAQNRFITDLENRLKSNSSTSEKFSIYGKLIEIYRSEHRYETATDYNRKLLQLAKKENNNLELSKAYVFAGIILNNQELYDKVSSYIDSANTVALKSKDPFALAYVSYLRAYQDNSYDDNRKAITHIQKTFSLLEKTKGDTYLEFKLNYLLYGIYTEWNNLKNSEKYAQKCIEIAQKSGNKNDLSNAYSAMAVVYTYQYEKSNDKKDLDKVFEYTDKAISLYQDFPGQVAGYTYTIARNNKANYLLVYHPELTLEIRQEIIYNATESLRIGEKLQKSTMTQAGSLGILSEVEYRDGNLDKSIEYLLKAETTLLKEQPVYYHIMTRVVSGLATIYEEKGELKKALEYQRKVVKYHSQLFNQQEAEAVKKLEAQYESEKKEQQIQLLEERADNHKKRNYLLVAIIAIGTVGAFFMFRSYHFNLRYSLSREKQLEAEKQEAELQVKLEKEEQARLKAEQELLALQQQKLQDEVMANQLHIQHKNEVLQQLKEKLDDDKSLNINQIIREENLLDNDFEKAKFQIQEIHPNFFKTLNEKAKQKLTSLDLKYCAYFYLGMDTKQIANILNVEPKSVRMTKYRLKQKFGLDSEIDLVDFVKRMVND